MQTLPPTMLQLLLPFAPLFSGRVWRRVLVLVAGTLLAMGLSQVKHCACYHRVLSRATWSSLAVSRVLLGVLVAVFAPTGPVLAHILWRRPGWR